jgi:hypothetical protein
MDEEYWNWIHFPDEDDDEPTADEIEEFEFERRQRIAEQNEY